MEPPDWETAVFLLDDIIAVSTKRRLLENGRIFWCTFPFPRAPKADQLRPEEWVDLNW